MNENNSNNMLVGLVIGAAAGAALALLMTPRAGREMRQVLGEAASHLKRGAEGTLGDVRHTLRDGAKDLTAAVSAGRDAYRDRSAASPSIRENA